MKNLLQGSIGNSKFFMCFFGQVLLVSVLLVARESEGSSWNDYKTRNDPSHFPITQILEGDGDKGSILVIVAAGSQSGIIKGMTLDAVRKAPGGLLEGQKLQFLPPNTLSAQLSGVRPAEAKKTLWVHTGKLRALDVQERFTIARVESQASPLSEAFFPKFSGIMVGDLVTVPEIRVARRPVIVETLTLGYFDIFEDPKARPATFELSRAGYRELKEVASLLSGLKLSMLLVEGYTDHRGPAEENQRESYQRALTVRQHLIDEFHFDPARVVAIGYGELEPKDISMAPGFEQRNRRIVFKAVPLSESSGGSGKRD